MVTPIFILVCLVFFLCGFVGVFVSVRVAARVLPITVSGEVLLIKGHDGNNPDFSWWFTVGGGLSVGEDVVSCVVREFFEETGYLLSVDQLLSCVVVRKGKFEFSDHVLCQNEYVFLVVLDEKFLPDTSNFTSSECCLIDRLSWWNIDVFLSEYYGGGLVVFPESLVELLVCVRGLAFQDKYSLLFSGLEENSCALSFPSLNVLVDSGSGGVDEGFVELVSGIPDLRGNVDSSDRCYSIVETLKRQFALELGTWLIDDFTGSVKRIVFSK